MRFCIFCGVEIPKDAKYCQMCGKVQPEETTAAEPEGGAEEGVKPPAGLQGFLDSPKKMILAGTGAFLIVLALATGVMILILKN